MAEEKKFGAQEINDPEMFAALLNKQFAKYNELLSGTASKGEVRQMQADLIVENKSLLDRLTAEGDKAGELRKQLESFQETVKIQGETITKMKSAFVPNEQKKSFAQKLAESIEAKEFKDFAEGRTSKARFQLDLKDVAFTGTYGSGAVGHAYMPFQVPQMPPAENFDARLILPTGTIDSSSLNYPTERSAGLTNAMTHESENGSANESTMDFTMGTAYATRIATFIEVSRSALKNSAWLNQYISNRLMQMFVAELNSEAIAGAGSGAGMVGDNALKGLLAFANTFAGTNFASAIANANYFDVLNCAKGEMNGLYHIVPNTYLVNPYTATILTSSKNTISDFVSPATFLQQTATGYQGAFGMRQIESADITVGTYLAAAINPAYMQLLFNGPIEILASDSHSSNFIADLVTIKLEARVLLPVYNANALMKGTFATDLGTILAGA